MTRLVAAADILTWGAVAAIVVACSEPPPPLPPVGRLPPNSFAFGVFGDGPYERREVPRFKRVLDDVNRSDVEWLLHVGDILWYPCSDSAFADRLASMNAVNRAVVYTPGDNEWADCHTMKEGRYAPLDRLAALRRMFFSNPARSLGRRPLTLESQAQDPVFTEFPENARWTYGGFVFATIHLVGSSNAGGAFRGRTAANDAEVVRRTRAAISWLDAAFARARERSAKGVVLALHADMGLEGRSGPGRAYAVFVDRLKRNVAGFSGPVVLIHGDSHIQRVDHPLTDSAGRPYANFTRLETFGSPDIGWVRVVVDTVAGRITGYEPRLMR
jgi:hypothetical protein